MAFTEVKPRIFSFELHAEVLTDLEPDLVLQAQQGSSVQIGHFISPKPTDILVDCIA
jgi:hypothetical protein